MWVHIGKVNPWISWTARLPAVKTSMGVQVDGIISFAEQQGKKVGSGIAAVSLGLCLSGAMGFIPNEMLVAIVRQILRG